MWGGDVRLPNGRHGKTWGDSMRVVTGKALNVIFSVVVLLLGMGLLAVGTTYLLGHSHGPRTMDTYVRVVFLGVAVFGLLFIGFRNLFVVRAMERIVERN